MEPANTNRYFKDRTEAGQKLAKLFRKYPEKDAVIYALPRGGVVLGVEIAKQLNAPLDLIITRKIGHPRNFEYAIGAITENGHAILNKEELKDVGSKRFKEEVEKQKIEAKRRRELYIGDRKPINCTGKVAVLVDDGIATGLTIKAAIKELKMHYQPKKIIVAVPVIPSEVADELESLGVKVLSVIKDQDFLGSIGAYYQNFSPVEDSEVIKVMTATH